MTAVSPATARTPAIFGSCASAHFLNPLVGLLIELPMIGILFEIQKIVYGDDFNLTESYFYDLAENFLVTSSEIIEFTRK